MNEPMNKIDKLIAELCPEGVSSCSLGEVMTIVRGASPRPISSFITDDINGINWIKIGDVKPDAKYITTTSQRITAEGANKSRLLKKGDFLIRFQ